jgi:tetratricopeptide repeat protein 21B
MNNEDLTQIHYYASKKLYHSLYLFCSSTLRKKIGDPVLLFWKAYALIKENKITEAIEELQQLQEKRELLLACPLALIYAHEKCKIIDREAIEELQAKFTIAANLQNIVDRAYLQAALFYYHTGDMNEATANIKRALSINANCTFATVLLGYVELNSNHEHIRKNSQSRFDSILNNNPKNIEALMGRLNYLRTNHIQYNIALDTSSELIVYYPSFLPAYIERSYLYIELSQWDQANKSARVCLDIDPNNLDSYYTIALTHLCKDGNYNDAVSILTKLFELIKTIEPNNAELTYNYARPIIRISGRKRSVLNVCEEYIDFSIEKEPENNEYKLEKAYIDQLKYNYQEALNIYKSVLSIDSQNIHAVKGFIRCLIMVGNYNEAEEHLEFLIELQSSLKKSAEIHYYYSLLVWLKYHNMAKRINFLNEAVDILLEISKCSPIRTMELNVKLNPELMLEMVESYFEHCPTEPKREGEMINPIIKRIHELLVLICKMIPGSMDALYYMAKVNYLVGDNEMAKQLVTECLNIEPSFVDAHLLMAQIYIEDKSSYMALQSLDKCLSYNFKVRQNPIYYLLRAKCEKADGHLEEALNTLNEIMNLPSFKNNNIPNEDKVNNDSSEMTRKLSLRERIGIYLELIDTHCKLHNLLDAARIMQEAICMFKGTEEEDQLSIANANLCLERNEIPKAIELLSKITPEKYYYIEAKCKLADIYLKYKNNKKAYALCYQEILENNPTTEVKVLLADAYMNIQEPEKAIKIYEDAFDANPEENSLALKIGQALVKTHNYNKAIDYYEAALELNSSISISLKYELAELYMKLSKFDESEKLIKSALTNHHNEEPAVLSEIVKLYQLLSKIYQKSEKNKESINALLKAREYQLRVIAKEPTITQQADTSPSQKLLSNICKDIADIYTIDNNFDKALLFYNEAIERCSTNHKAILALAKLYVKENDLLQAQTQCSLLLKLELAIDEATMLLADIMFRKNSYSSAIFHFKYLLEKNPTHYVAFAKLLHMMRRCGKLDEADSFFEMIGNKMSSKIEMDAGWHYCKGLFHRFTYNPNEALKEFGYARKDAEWGEKALYNMIEIFLNPDEDTIGGEALENKSSTSDERGTNTDLIVFYSADKIIKALPNPDSIKGQIYYAHALLATKQKKQIEEGLNIFMEILKEKKEYVPALYGLATAYMLLKQPPRARNQLKRVTKLEYTEEFSNEFEKCWLLLADLYIKGGKFDLATDLLKKVLSYNKSCFRAWEYMGFIMEKEASYVDAAYHYENAWKLVRESNPAIGFKLAFNYMKANKFVDAIIICNKVLKAWPEYPKI